MRIISRATSGATVEGALNVVINGVNEELAKIDGVIMKTRADVSAGASGAYVSVSVAVAGSQPRKKWVIGINERGASRESSTKKAIKTLNSLISDKKGEIVDTYTKTITAPLPGRVYTTMIAALNEDLIETAKDSNQRRVRLKKVIELLENDPSAVNVSKVAKIFGVSRIIIYKDLEELGFKRTSLKKSH